MFVGLPLIDMLFGVVVLVVLAAAVVAHLAWVGRLARAPGLRTRSGAARGLIVALAAATPVVGFYAAAVLGRCRASPVQRVGQPARLIALSVLWTLVFAAAGAARVETGYAAEYRSLGHAAEGFVRQALFLAVAQLILFMIARVFAPERWAVALGAMLTAAFTALFAAVPWVR